MANIIRNFIDSLHLADDDDMDEEYDEYLAETNERERRRAERSEKRMEKTNRRFAQEEEEEEPEPEYRSNTSNFSDIRRERAAKPERERERPQSSKVVPFRGSSSSNVNISVMKPTNFEDSQDMCDVLLAGKAVVINLEGFDVDIAQRVMDFVSGAVYAVNGKLHQVSSYIFIVCPESIEISGDYSDILKQTGFEVPRLFGRS